MRGATLRLGDLTQSRGNGRALHLGGLPVPWLRGFGKRGCNHSPVCITPEGDTRLKCIFRR